MVDLSPPHKPPVQLDVGKIRVLLGDPNTPGLVLMLIILWTFGPRVFGDPEIGTPDMDPAEIWAELYETYGTWLTEEGESRVNALLTVSDGLFHNDPEAFSAVALALADGDIGDIIEGEFDPPGAAEVMWAILEVELYLESSSVELEFNPRVEHLVEAIMKTEPEDLTAISEAINESYIEMLEMLRDLGVPDSALRLYDNGYVDAITMLEESGDFEFSEKTPG